MTAKSAKATMSLVVEVANRQAKMPIDESTMVTAVTEVLGGEAVSSAEISIAVVDDAEIHQLNRRYLNHDYETDVLSFVLEDDGEHLQGEVIVSAETAARLATEYGWSAASELLLYLIHGTLHLVGYDDKRDTDRQEMRQKEREYLQRCGIEVPVARSLEGEDTT